MRNKHFLGRLRPSRFLSIYIIAENQRKIKFWDCVEIVRSRRGLAGRQGFEPRLTVLETASLPLADLPIPLGKSQIADFFLSGDDMSPVVVLTTAHSTRTVYLTF